MRAGRGCSTVYFLPPPPALLLPPALPLPLPPALLPLALPLPLALLPLLPLGLFGGAFARVGRGLTTVGRVVGGASVGMLVIAISGSTGVTVSVPISVGVVVGVGEDSTVGVSVVATVDVAVGDAAWRVGVSGGTVVLTFPCRGSVGSTAGDTAGGCANFARTFSLA